MVKFFLNMNNNKKNYIVFYGMIIEIGFYFICDKN